MPYRAFEGQNCSIADALGVVGERWTLLVVREILLGHRRFREIQRRTGAATNILADRLRTLTDQGVLEQASDGEYQPTRRALDLVPVLIALSAWGDAHLHEGERPREFRHLDCGGEVDAALTCERCGKPVPPAAVRVFPGPGASEEQRAEGVLPALA